MSGSDRLTLNGLGPVVGGVTLGILVDGAVLVFAMVAAGVALLLARFTPRAWGWTAAH